MTHRRHLGHFDTVLFLATIAVLALGVVFLYSATLTRSGTEDVHYVTKQLLFIAVGMLALFVIVRIDYQRLIDVSYVLYVINIIALALVFFLGTSKLGAQRWFAIGGFGIQPSEFIKIVLVLALASYIGQRKYGMQSLTSLVVPVIMVAIPFFLIVSQPDLGTALLLLPVAGAMLYIGGARIKHLLAMLIVGVAGIPVFWGLLREYQQERLLVFIDPSKDPLGAGYTIIQSKIAIGSGGLAGKGWLAGTQNIFNFLTERHTDFIFSVIGEEWGFVGAIVVISLYLVIIMRGFSILTSTNDMYGRLIAIGVITLLCVQVFVNIAMTIGIMPVVGLPLPLISYGGSSMINTLIAVGLLLNVGTRRTIF